MHNIAQLRMGFKVPTWTGMFTQKYPNEKLDEQCANWNA